jgi:hypothetical protein
MWLELLVGPCGADHVRTIADILLDWWIEGRKVGPVCMDRKRNMPGPVVERNWNLDGLVGMLGHNANNSLAEFLVNGVERRQVIALPKTEEALCDPFPNLGSGLAGKVLRVG